VGLIGAIAAFAGCKKTVQEALAKMGDAVLDPADLNTVDPAAQHIAPCFDSDL
jgi:hypothetical protein